MDVYCINLPHRKDRWYHVVKMCERYPFLRLHFVEAVQHEKGLTGCLRSHKKIVQSAKDAGNPYIIVIEDDCDFIVNSEVLKTQFETIVAYMAEHPEVQLISGCGNLIDFSITEYETFRSTTFLRSPDIRTTHIMFYNASSYDAFLNFDEIRPIDEQINDHAIVYTYPYLARQLPSYSDISKHVVNYTNIDRSMEFVKRSVESR